ncbi:hypothetical protein BS50DRAFT_567102 [Corynespora cassiicola Philippines]|uniref:Xaa-Pro aminopeptidase n=1 Tax=Corynespora cassiicola Philippines TaxID=1448308 RepID=A0A2T2P9A3_CORCC|nr:hypothetical protein BS50DRAFT_567102 [Corynespora cassiicola Philippines]
MEPLNAYHLEDRLKSAPQEYWLHLEAKSPLEKYPAKQHARRVQEKLGADDGLIYLPGSKARNNEDSDMPAPFRQRRYFYYLSGCNEPGCHLTYDIQEDSLALFIPRIDASRVIWNGRGSTPAEAKDKYDIDEVYYVDELEDFLKGWAVYRRGNLYTLRASQTPVLPGLPVQVDLASLRPAMNLTRMVKDDHEISLIRKANDISSQAHKEVLANILKFKNEAQVQGLFLDVCISRQAKEQAYDPIAASGPNAGTLHYDANNEDFGDRQLMCLDAGCEYQLYASDITRTFPLSGDWPSLEAKNIYQLVQRMQENCIKRLAPGVRYLDLHVLAHQIAIDGLLALGILHNGTREEIYKAGTSRAFFPHGLGHHVGLEVHDVGQGDLMSVNTAFSESGKAPSIYPQNFHLPVYDSTMCMAPVHPQSGHLEEGNVVTVEPGIYFSTYALNMFYLPSPIHSKYINVEVVKRYLPVGGVRIEDDILITSKGYENLTSAPKGEAMLEIIRSQNAHWPFVSGSADLGPAPATSDESKPIFEAEALRRAPGISRAAAEPILKPLRRASTTPAEESNHRKSTDFEPFEGPSLFSNFRSSTTTEDNVQRWREATQRPARGSQHAHVTNECRIPVCGENTSEFTHAYVDMGSFGSPTNERGSSKKPMCRNCSILVQSVDRLRQSLAQNSPKPDSTPKFELGGFEKVPVVDSQSPRRTSTNFEPLRSYNEAPANPITQHGPTNPTLWQMLQSNRPRPQSQSYAPVRRSVTFDNYTSPANHMHIQGDYRLQASGPSVPASNPSPVFSQHTREMPQVQERIPTLRSRTSYSGEHTSFYEPLGTTSPVSRLSEFPACQRCSRAKIPCQRSSTTAICHSCAINNKVCANMPAVPRDTRQQFISQSGPTMDPLAMNDLSRNMARMQLFPEQSQRINPLPYPSNYKGPV